MAIPRFPAFLFNQVLQMRETLLTNIFYRLRGFLHVSDSQVYTYQKVSVLPTGLTPGLIYRGTVYFSGEGRGHTFYHENEYPIRKITGFNRIGLCFRTWTDRPVLRLLLPSPFMNVYKFQILKDIDRRTLISHSIFLSFSLSVSEYESQGFTIPSFYQNSRDWK